MNDIDLDKPVNQIVIGGLLTIAFTCLLLLLFIYTPVYSECWSNQSGIGCSFGVLDAPPQDSYKKQQDELIEPDESIPEEYINSSFTSNVSVSFERDTEGNQILERFSHDAMITKENDTYYLIVGIDGKQTLYKSQNITDKSSWKLADGNYLTSIHEGDDIIRKENQLVVHSSYSVYTTNNSIEVDNWTKRVNVSNYELEDGGIYYDEDEDMYHFYYEKGSKASNSGVAIGHAVSPNGVDNWTIYPEVWNASDVGYGVGDFDVVEVKNTVIILGDYDRYHPKYSIAVWANSNPYTEFEKMDEFALEPRDAEENFSDNFGASDPELVRTDDGFVMFANGHRNNNSTSSTLQMYKGDISVK